jgi:hypothetical protein
MANSRKSAPVAVANGETQAATAKTNRVQKDAAKTAGTVLSIIKDSKALGNFISSTMKAYAQNGINIHVAVVSAMHHAAVTGDPVYLTRIMNGLRPNDQNALRFFIRRSAIEAGLELLQSKYRLDQQDADGNPIPVPADVISAAYDAGSWLKYTRDSGFSVTKGHTTDQAKKAATIMESRVGSAVLVLQRDNFTESRTLSDTDALKGLIRAAKAIETDSARTNVQVSNTVSKFFAEVRDKAQTMLNLNDLSKA